MRSSSSSDITQESNHRHHITLDSFVENLSFSTGLSKFVTPVLVLRILANDVGRKLVVEAKLLLFALLFDRPERGKTENYFTILT